MLWSPAMTVPAPLKLALLSTVASATLMAAWAGWGGNDLAAAEPAGRAPANAKYRDARAPIADRVADLAIPELARSVPAILDGFYRGEETGTAVAEVLFGDVSPAGRLPVSVPRQVGTIPAYYNYKPSARRLYLSEEPGPLWPFGFGLSYTSFRYEKLAVTPARIAPDGKTVTNTGKRASDEVVQLYIHDVVSSVTRPISELKGFRPIHLKAAESKKVELAIGAGELSFHDEGMKRVVEPGRFEVMVGGSSADVKKVDLEVASQ